MTSLKILNKREIRSILEKIKEQYEINKLNLDYIFLKNKDNKIYILSKDFGKIDTKNIRINSLGMYFAKIQPDGIRLSIGGSQLIGPSAKKNVLEVNKNEINSWIRGNNIKTNRKLKGYLIIKHKNDYYGCGFYKDKKIINMIPKDRMIKK